MAAKQMPKTLGAITRPDGSQVRVDWDSDEAKLTIYPMVTDSDGIRWNDLRRHPIVVEAEHLKKFTSILQLAVQEVIRQEMRQSVADYEQIVQARGKP